jgi:hypothetical protein
MLKFKQKTNQVKNAEQVEFYRLLSKPFDDLGQGCLHREVDLLGLGRIQPLGFRP